MKKLAEMTREERRETTKGAQSAEASAAAYNTDKNGNRIKAGDIVRIEGAYFKVDNGLWFVEEDGTNPTYNGGDSLTLHRIGTAGKISTAKYATQFWPLVHFCNSPEKNALGNSHDKHFATIEIIKTIDNGEVIARFKKEAEEKEESAEWYRLRGYGEAWIKPNTDRAAWLRSVVARMEAEKAQKEPETEPAPDNITRFEVGTVYSMRSACDHECRWFYKIAGRTAATVTLESLNGDNKTLTRKIFVMSYNGQKLEAVRPLGSYSMAPILSADHPEEEPKPAEAEPVHHPDREPLKDNTDQEIKIMIALAAYLENIIAHGERTPETTDLLITLQETQGRAAQILKKRAEAAQVQEPIKAFCEKCAKLGNGCEGIKESAVWTGCIFRERKTTEEPETDTKPEEIAEAEPETVPEATAEIQQPAEIPESNYFVENKETGKIELHFDKSDYMSLTDTQKAEIKSAFLFSRYSSAWVSRCKFPHLSTPRRIASKLGLTDAGTIGERLSFEAQQERKNERAEARADRAEERAGKARQEAARLQKPINDMHGDIAFFTQPNINSAGGRRFSRQRKKMFNQFEKGFEYQTKADRLEDKAEDLRASTAAPSASFATRRIKEAEADIRARKRALERWNLSEQGKQLQLEAIAQSESKIEYYKQFV